MRRAFSLIEVMFASGIAALGLLTLLSALYAVQRAGQKTATSQRAEALADQLLERTVREVARRDQDAFWNTPSGSHWKEGASEEFLYQVDSVEILDRGTGSPLGVSTGANDNTLRRLDVTVWWWSEQAGSRPGYGDLKVSQSRLLNRTRIGDL